MIEKRGLSVVENNQLSEDGISEKLLKKLDRTDFIFKSIAGKEQRKKEIIEAIEKEEGADGFIGVTDISSVSDGKRSVKQYHIVGFAATRLDDSKKKWQLNKVVMGSDGLLTS